MKYRGTSFNVLVVIAALILRVAFAVPPRSDASEPQKATSSTDRDSPPPQQGTSRRGSLPYSKFLDRLGIDPSPVPGRSTEVIHPPTFNPTEGVGRPSRRQRKILGKGFKTLHSVQQNLEFGITDLRIDRDRALEVIAKGAHDPTGGRRAWRQLENEQRLKGGTVQADSATVKRLSKAARSKEAFRQGILSERGQAEMEAARIAEQARLEVLASVRGHQEPTEVAKGRKSESERGEATLSGDGPSPSRWEEHEDSEGRTPEQQE